MGLVEGVDQMEEVGAGAGVVAFVVVPARS
jgi:hypothetical protein